ncbi:hypothetical protein NW759_007750 [Fusarium solani]|uniref:NmrA-like domain-containing protein n=1 Tax=Fusarium solani TaxID=169388 RepID=A0A9P9GYC1_FUSSL|nr:uncharacterized protein B0J15DRAFT_79040 [Fusarium solani]KAH7246983.1 hypothetical protein B0J15DRAFT_79040 [Fusarium solani]KAJ4219361.1 hypothetical protein NW759_007750 [Fusarium solani]
MVKVAIAGIGELAQELIKVLLKGGGHEITALSRKDSPRNIPPGLSWSKVDYNDKPQLARTLRGFDAVLSFILVFSDEAYRAQLNLIDAAIEAGVKRFAPSEWSMFVLDHYPMYSYKLQTRQYLEHLNRDGKVLEYSLFTPGIFMDYLGPPEKLNQKNLSYSGLFIDFEKCRAILPEYTGALISFVAVDDLIAVVNEALEFDSDWPVIGGISGSRLTISDLVQLGETIRGEKFTVEVVGRHDLQLGKLGTSWIPGSHHSGTSSQQQLTMEQMTAYTLLAIPDGHWNLSDEWNKLLPAHKFLDIETFLREAWS